MIFSPSFKFPGQLNNELVLLVEELQTLPVQISTLRTITLLLPDSFVTSGLELGSNSVLSVVHHRELEGA